MKKIILFLVFSLVTINIYSQGTTCATATAFCGADINAPSLVFPSATTGTGLADGCLLSAPRPAWFYLKVDRSGPLVYDIIQNRSFDSNGLPTGLQMDVDFAVWGPYASAVGNCSNRVNNCPPCGNNTTSPGNYPRPAPGNLVDCSFDGAAVEHMTIPSATAGQFYLVMVTNYTGGAGFIKLEQRPPILPTSGHTDCDIVCGVSLGPDRKECIENPPKDINITASFASPATSTATIPYQWSLDGVPQPAYDNMQTITVNTPGTWSVKTTRPGGCYQVTSSMVYSNYLIPATQPKDIVLCTSSAPPYIFPSINKNSEILGTLSASDYTITYHTSQAFANNGTAAIPFASLTNYLASSSPVTIYARIEDNISFCYTTKHFDLIVTTAPAGTFTYANPTYCTSIITPQPIIPVGLTTSGIFTTNPSTGLTINGTTGEITPSTSTPGNYTVKYEIAASPSCPLYSTSTTVTIATAQAITINCGITTTSSITFDWTAVIGATGYNISYQVNTNPTVNVGAIGNVLTYLVSGLTPADTVVITVTPTGPLGSCFSSSNKSCGANNCTPPTAAISYSLPSTPSTSFCESDTAPKLVNLTGTGLFAPGNYTANPNTLIINATTGTITPNGSPAANYTITYTIPAASAGCSPVTATTLVTIHALPTITGALNACIGTTTQLTGLGTANTTNPWISSNSAVATVSSTGLVTGVTVGNATITYKNSNGCDVTAIVTINALPTITGTLNACVGTTTQLTGLGTANTTNPWVSDNIAIATVSNTGLVTGVTGGTAIITYTNSNGCDITAIVTVNALPTITGALNTCIGTTTQLTGSGTANATNPWISSNNAIATVSNTGLVTGVSVGSATITYKNSNGCDITAIVTVTLPTITGALNACIGTTTQLTGSGTANATNPWISSNSAIATVSNTGLVTGVSVGSATITYKNSNGCDVTAIVTVNALPTITGALNTCIGTTTQLTGSGTANTTNPWVSDNIAIANVSNTGLVTGVTGGTAIITYTNSNGCATKATVTINNPSAPGVITPITYCLNDITNPITATGSNLLWYATVTGGVGSTIAPTPLTTAVGNTNYYVSQTVGTCESPRAVITSNISEPPATIVATPSNYFADLQTITVTVTPAGEYEYQIDNGAFQNSNIFANVSAGLHNITVRNECVSKSTTAYIVDYPRFFTPNGDGYHDTWNIPELKNQANAKVLIFDRFGKLLTEIRPSGSGWNGTFNGKELPSTDYWFVVTYEENGITKEHKSHFSMKR
ncbi:Ig-like domain-containing protein [Flavobacterium psychrophilum]